MVVRSRCASFAAASGKVSAQKAEATPCMMTITFAFFALASILVAQVPATPPIAPGPIITGAPLPSAIVDTRGPCLDSAKQVPNVVGEPLARSSEIVRIDRVVSDSAYTLNQIIGFLYTRDDGKTYLGMRTLQYTSPASAQELNQVLASTRAVGVSETEFPPQTRLGVPTRYSQFFQVKIPPAAMEPLKVRLESCVAWPSGRALPDPMGG